MSDLISRQLVIDALNRLSLGETDAIKLTLRMNEYLKRLSSAQPERKTGKWVNGFCSICGKEAVTEWNENGGEYLLSDFCPFCGADTREAKRMSNLIDRQAAISLAKDICVPTKDGTVYRHRCIDPDAIRELPSAQPEIIRCKDCKYGKQDEDGRWFCSDLGCQIGDKDGNGFCSDAERRTDG